MTKNKISALEKLQLKKIRLQAEADTHANNLDDHINYLQNNFGSLLVNTAISAAKSRIASVVQNFLPDNSVLVNSGNALMKEQENQSMLALIADQAIDIIPIFFKGSKPVIIAFLLKQAKNFFFGRKKK